MSDSDVHEITCPACSKTFQLRRLNLKARTCPHCGHVGPRSDFAEKPIGGDPPAPSSDPPAGAQGERAPAAAASSSTPPEKPARKLGGAAAIAHAQKLKGQPVTIGNVRGGKRAAAVAAAASDRVHREHHNEPPPPAARAPRLIDRLKRIL
jgi:hypothetical protein